MTDKKLIFKIYKQLIQPNSKKQTNKQKKNWLQKWEGNINRLFFQRKHTDSQEAYKKMPNITNHQRNAN